MNQAPAGVLLSITELGGYPDFSPLYREAGFDVVATDNLRKAVKLIRQHRPRVIVAEFNYQSDFRDRTSSLETLMSSTQGITEANLIVFYEKEYEHQYKRFRQQYDVHASLPFPVDEGQLKTSLESANA